MFVTAIIAAGGRGARLGGETPKQLRTLAGRSLLARTVDVFLAHRGVSEIVVALPPDLVENPPADLPRDGSKPLHIVAGGARRQDSVANAFGRVSRECEVVLVHDAARPFVSADLITRAIAAAATHGAALVALSARDTVKRTEVSPSADRVVAETLARDTIILAQTPQAFRREVLTDALARGECDGIEVTDEASLAERAGHAVHVVEGDPLNIKITTAEDLALAEVIAQAGGERADRPARPARTGRAGTGYDLHRLVAGRSLVLGGVTIPAEKGALGHSDADVVCHAVTDAILGAARLGDIGRHFPDTDPLWKGASSLDMLSRAAAMVARAGFEVGNVDVTVILEAPKIKPYIDAMQTAVAGAIGIDPDRVSVKGKTNEGVDAVGRGEAIAAHAIALLRRA
jgi:2-C-methyl-D-erythritol 4-phosphate cytidylyltransferase / 2-C-methyl-D-erythritol 2,4-cyclodiphosphate synthase